MYKYRKPAYPLWRQVAVGTLYGIVMGHVVYLMYLVNR